MITVDENRLRSVEYLIKQSKEGNHLLFDLDTVRKVFIKPEGPSMTADEVREVEGHIETLITLDHLEKQRRYLSTLPEAVLDRVVKTYFNIVENHLFESTRVRH